MAKGKLGKGIHSYNAMLYSNGIKKFLSESPFGYYDDLKLASKRLLGTFGPFGPGASN